MALIVGRLVYQFLKPEKITSQDVLGTYIIEDSREKRKLNLSPNGFFVQTIEPRTGVRRINSGTWRLDFSTGDARLVYLDLEGAESLTSHQSGVWSLLVTHSFLGKWVLEIDTDQNQAFEKLSP